jgi:CubicO group peptidase (beta-lactamase class C family)
MNLTKYIALFFIQIILMLFEVQAQNKNSNIEPAILEAYIDSVFSEYNSLNKPGVAIALVRNNKVIFKKGYGMANIQEGKKITTSTVFEMGSVSKQFTGFAISSLIEQGKISLNDDIRMYIPEFPDFGHIITINNLVHMTSGLREWTYTLECAGRYTKDTVHFQEVLTMLYNQKELNFIPGTKYIYSNTNYNVLAELVQRVTKMSFRKWTDLKTFKPLNMNNSLIYDDSTEVITNKALGYYYKDSRYRIQLDNSTVYGSASVYTTIDDFSKWAIHFNSSLLKNDAVINRMLQQGVLSNGEEIIYAFGVGIDKYKGINRIAHFGYWSSFNSYSGYFPDQDFSLIIFSNEKTFSPGPIAKKVVDYYLKEFLDNTPSSLTEKKKIELNIKHQKPFEGWYWDESSWTAISVYIKNDSLRLDLGGGNEQTLIPISSNEFRILNENKIVKFKNEDKKKILEIIYPDGYTTDYNYYDFIQYSNKELKKFVGIYHSEELNVNYEVVLKEEKLSLKNIREEVALSFSVKPNLFVTGLWYMNEFQFEEGDNKEIKGLRISSSKSKNLWFQKIN